MTTQPVGSRVVVFHVSDVPTDLDRAIGAAGRLVDARPDESARIIVNGPALTGLIGSGELATPPEVSIEACEFGLAQRGLSMRDVRAGVGSVPSAVLALADAQRDGASYIRV